MRSPSKARDFEDNHPITRKQPRQRDARPSVPASILDWAHALAGMRTALSVIGLHFDFGRSFTRCAKRRRWSGCCRSDCCCSRSCSCPLRILEAEGLPRYRALRNELLQTRENNARMRREVQELKQRVQRLRNDPQAIERIARDELGMLRSDEIVFQFSD